MGRVTYTPDKTRVAQARLAAGFAVQADAAQSLGVNRVTLNKIENGRANLSLDLLERMADLYGCSRGFLLGLDDQVDPVLVNRDRIAKALAKIAEGFEELELVDVLNAQAHAHAVDGSEVPAP